MKVFVPHQQDWPSLKEELEKKGKTILVEKGKIKGAESTKFDGKRASIVAETDLRSLLEFLADSGYDFVALSDTEANYPRVSTVEEVMNVPDFDSLKSLIARIKTVPGVEKCGAIGIFVGFVRELSGDRQVVRLEYEENPEVFDSKLSEIEDKLKSYPGVVEVKILHRTGILSPGEDIIYVVVMGEHRKNVWGPLEKSMDIIKKELPIWKKEVYVDGEMWAHDTSGAKENE
ncbi:MAG: molybdenum cofactor biosynthesis protein MoaE [Archaeoglobaceae archaeon]